MFTWQELRRLLDLVRWPEAPLPPRYNVAPTQSAPVVIVDAGGARAGAMMRWGLVPSWADDPSIGSRMINARAEGVESKPAFRAAFKARRCVVPMSGFYEWQAVPGAKRKQPFWIRRRDQAPLAVAGLWEVWRKGEAPLESFVVVTTSANEFMRPIHDRMPVVFDREQVDAWLAPSTTDAASLTALLRPCPAGDLEALPVHPRVNSPGVDNPSLIEPLADMSREKKSPSSTGENTLWGNETP
jgi:putative SOS response-associated peptidase YedK